MLASMCMARPDALLAADCIRPNQEVVTGVVLRAGPSSTTEKLGTLTPGQVLPLAATIPYWYETRFAGQPAFASRRWVAVGDCSETPPQSPAAPADTAAAYTIEVFDVGTGLSVLVRGSDFAVLYDGGSNDDVALGAGNRVVAYLKAQTPAMTSLSHVILSHPHKDHDLLLPDVLEQYRPEDVWDSGSRGNMTCEYWAFLQAVSKLSSVRYHTVKQDGAEEVVSLTPAQCPPAATRTVTLHHGKRIDSTDIQLGAGASMQILYADGTDYTPAQNPNKNSLVVRFTLGARHALFMGDAPGGERAPPSNPPQKNSIEAKLLICCSQELFADIRIAGHHGSSTSSRNALVNAVGATIYVISSGPFPYGGTTLPSPEIVSSLKSRGQLFETYANDAQCRTATQKIGPDNDGRPGGCDAVRIAIAANGQMAAGYDRSHD